ncbi:MAG: hypothetical protein KAG99_09285, partial [Bacteroidales bacterium]|nr:hypothetical protein [Bacteroidales bacterium]
IRVSPRINKYNIRRIILNLEIDYTIDIFTTRYINRWLGRYPTFDPNQMFGIVNQTVSGESYIEGGVRYLNNIALGGDLSVNLLNEMSLSIEHKHYSATELTDNYLGNFLKMSYSTRPLHLGTQFAGLFSASGGTFYNFDQKYVGNQRSLSLKGEGRLSNNVTASLLGGFTKTYDNMDEYDGQYFKLSSNTTWMFTKDFFVRLHAQGIFITTYYNQKQIHDDYLLSCLISWEYRPGSFLYLAYNEGRFDESNPTKSRYFEFNDRTIVLKISYFFSV